MINFETRIINPAYWFTQSWQLFEASKANYELFESMGRIYSEKDNHRKVGLMNSTMLLLGLATENALKGALVFKSKPELKNDKLNPKHFHEFAHELSEVVEKLDLNISTQEQELIDRLSMFVQWSAKYQTPLRKVDYEQSQGMQRLNYPRDFIMAEKLINLLQSQSGYTENSGWK